MKNLIVFCLLALWLPVNAQKKQVVVLDIRDEIDPPMKRYVELGLKYAEDQKADIILIDMDTYGGVLTDAKEIVDMIMAVKKPVWVFINTDAASAGALISIACDSIYMAPGASIGAATVVTGTGEKAPDKYQSYMRSIMRSTAEENKRDPRIAEKMVDETLSLDSISPAGRVITFSTTEALKYGYCEAKVTSIDEIMKRNNIIEYEVDRFELNGVEEIVAFFLNPFISGLLILVFLGGLYFELQTPGVGFPGIAALVALVLYLVPYYLTDLAQAWEIIALITGLALIAVEIFILPGFGLAGISGIALTVLSLILIMIDNDFFDFEYVPFRTISTAIITTLSGLVGSLLLLFIGGAKLADSKLFSRVALTDTQDSSKGFTASFFPGVMAGKKGTAHTILRPGGKVLIDGRVYDAYSQGEFIGKGEEVIVIGQETTSLRVRRAEVTTSAV